MIRPPQPSHGNILFKMSTTKWCHTCVPKKRGFAFQTFTETAATTPSILGFGISHQPHEGGGWCEMWCEIRRHTMLHLSTGYWSALRV